MCCHPKGGSKAHLLQFARCNVIEADAPISALTVLDLYKIDALGLLGHDIDFTETGAPVQGEDTITLLVQPRRSPSFGRMTGLIICRLDASLPPFCEVQPKSNNQFLIKA